MTPEQVLALESSYPAGSDEECLWQECCKAIAAKLREEQAAGEVAVDEAWLRSVGFMETGLSSDGLPMLSIGRIHMFPGGCWDWWFCNCLIRSQPTRAEVLALLKALGITITTEATT